jgi:hypothetical protein
LRSTAARLRDRRANTTLALRNTLANNLFADGRRLANSGKTWVNKLTDMMGSPKAATV